MATDERVLPLGAATARPDPPRRGLQAPGVPPSAPLLPQPPAAPPPDTAPPPSPQEGRSPPAGRAAMADQSYCHRLQHDMYFLTSNSRLNEQVVDKIILQLNRVYPQILTNAEAEKFRNPKASLHTRLSDLIKHLQKKGERHCQEFYRALQINAEQLYDDLPSRKILRRGLFLLSTDTYQWKTAPLSCLHREAAKLLRSPDPYVNFLELGKLGPSLSQTPK
ncbi:caspase recruitment domain-containing protein 19 isoform X3 [Neopsephotus bourkii]|uniref:caspase recruitment domain-containing protein 19 isoform X3 n=1 Tax=Neopsephotus bourkii TaxID=309878 RepID=UPI002AA5CFA8|nr:caspase recruitment domain-containing protein 19 isoform X3 [Neopsephotus bourkii]